MGVSLSEKKIIKMREIVWCEVNSKRKRVRIMNQCVFGGVLYKKGNKERVTGEDGLQQH